MIHKKNMFIFAIIFSLLILTGCKLTDEEIIDKLIEANSNLKSYSANLKISNAMRTEILGQEIDMIMTTDLSGKVDRLNKKMALNGIIKMEIAGLRTEVDADAYFIGDYMYTKLLNEWVKTTYDEDIWNQQDKFSQTVELVQSGSIERLEDETFNGNSYYVIKANPDLKKVVELELKQQEQFDLFNEKMNFEDIIRSYDFTVWINKKTFLIEKSKTNMKLVLNADNIGKKESLSGEIESDSSVELTISNINQEFEILLPEEAKNAKDLEEIERKFEDINKLDSTILDESSSDEPPIEERFEVIVDDDPFKGNENAPVTIVEFSDYPGPFSYRFFKETFPKIEENYINSGKVRYVFKDYPLSFHAQSWESAEASECAHDQGKFWEYHDALFNNQRKFGRDFYLELAQELNLDLDTFTQCIDTRKHNQEIQNDFGHGASVGVTGTPTFFINGIKLTGAQPYRAFNEKISYELGPEDTIINYVKENPLQPITGRIISDVFD